MMTAELKREGAAVVGAAAAAIERERALLLARNAEACSHLLVRLEPGEAPDTLIIRAVFTLDEQRVWHQAETRLSLSELTSEAGPDRALIAAFGQLDDGISAARIARLFAPASLDEYVA